MALALVAALLVGVVTPSTGQDTAGAAPNPSASVCPRSLKFAGALYLDADSRVPDSEVGPQVGATDPNPTQCGLADRLAVFRHQGHNTSDEIVYYLKPDQPELFRSAGTTGYPFQGLLRWLVLVLVVGILLFAALPALIAHIRQPPIGDGGREDDPPAT